MICSTLITANSFNVIGLLNKSTPTFMFTMNWSVISEFSVMLWLELAEKHVWCFLCAISGNWAFVSRRRTLIGILQFGKCQPISGLRSIFCVSSVVHSNDSVNSNDMAEFTMNVLGKFIFMFSKIRGNEGPLMILAVRYVPLLNCVQIVWKRGPISWKLLLSLPLVQLLVQHSIL